MAKARTRPRDPKAAPPPADSPLRGGAEVALAPPAAPEPVEALDQSALRELCWEIGTRFPFPFKSDLIALAPIRPRQAYIRWHARPEAVGALKARLGGSLDGAALVVRVYDVTDVIFDGFNAHRFFDIGVSELHGHHYLGIDQLERNLLAELGFRMPDGTFHALCRSNFLWCDRDRPAGRFQLNGLYVGRGAAQVFPVDNIMEAPVYERLHEQLCASQRARGQVDAAPLEVALLYPRIDPPSEMGGRLPDLLERINSHIERLDVKLERFGADEGARSAPAREEPPEPPESLEARLQRSSSALVRALRARHAKARFTLVHGHDWVSVPAALEACQALSLPFVLSLHATEHERGRGAELSGEGATICGWEQRGVENATLVIVPHAGTYHHVVNTYGAPEHRVVTIPDLFDDPNAALPDLANAKKQLHLDPAWPLVLFAGEISHAAGADLLVEALIQVCREHHTVHFAFAGNGPLKGELEGRAWHAGVGHRCRFLGDVPHHAFENVLLACDFVVIPARTWQDEGLAHLAGAFGKPVLITHQSQIRCIKHGENGLVTYDNPGSIIWGVKELLANPLHGNMLRLLARQKAAHTLTLEGIAVEHRLAYARALAAYLAEGATSRVSTSI